MRHRAVRSFLKTLVWAALAMNSFAQIDLGPEPTYSSWVTWQRPTADVDQAFAEALRDLVFSDEPSPRLVTEKPLLVVDPRMWNWLREAPGHTELDLVDTKVRIPRVAGSLQCEARCFRGEASARWLLPHLRQRYGVSANDLVTVRHPNSEEMDYVWALIPFDIDGSVLTLEGPQRRLVAMSVLGMVHLYELPAEPMGGEAALNSLANLPLTQREASPMQDRLDDKTLDFPGLLKPDDVFAMTLTEPEMLASRISRDDLEVYLKRLDEIITASVPKDAGRVLIQVNLDAGSQPTIYLRAPSKAAQDLKERLSSVTPPTCLGPVTFISVKDR